MKFINKQEKKLLVSTFSFVLKATYFHILHKECLILKTTLNQCYGFLTKAIILSNIVENVSEHF